MRSLFAAICLTVAVGAARGAEPAGGAPGAAGASETAPADVRVEKASDTVILTDGTKLTGTILAAGQRAIIMIEKDQTAERIINRSEIESYTFSQKGSGEIKGYTLGVRPDEGLPVIVGEGSAAPGSTPASTGPAKPGPGGTPAKQPAGKDLSGLWTLLGGNASAADLKAAITANPDWQAEIGKLLRGNVPPEGADAVAKFRARLLKEPDLQKMLGELMGGGGRGGRGGGNPGGATGGGAQGGGGGMVPGRGNRGGNKGENKAD